MRYLSLALILFSACASAAACDYKKVSGDHFQFAKRPDSGTHDYLLWHEQPSISADSLDYKKYGGLKGVLMHEHVLDAAKQHSFRKAITENCDLVYVEARREIALMAAVMSKDLDRAKNLIGKSIWVDHGYATHLPLFTSDPAISYPLSHREELMVVDVNDDYFGHGLGIGAFQLKVREKTGEVGFIKYNTIYFFKRMPTW